MPELSTNNPVLLYDGVCGLCNKAVQLILRHDHRGDLRFAALQSAYGKNTLAHHPKLRGADSLVLVETLNGEEHARTRSEAALRLASYLGGGWALLLVFRLVPRSIRDFFYDLLAKHRYSIFGKYDHCVVPSPDVRSRFLDLAE